MAKGKAQDLFRSKAPWIMALLMRDFPLQVDDAAAILGNLGHESGGLATLQEESPTVPSSRGGYGWAQWTGPRRRSFEAYCKRVNLNPALDQANYGFLFSELKGPYRKALDKLAAARTLQAKVKAFELVYEAAGVKHYDSRNRWAAIALEAYHASTPTLPTWALPAGKPASAQEQAPTTSDTAPAAKPAPSAPPVANSTQARPAAPAKKKWFAGIVAALGIGGGAGAAGWHTGAWLLFAVLALALVVAVAVWLHGRKA
ncbi:phage tail tip lysozyme [Mesorhizobium qingshengii]|uniref:Phage tail tip lysozyme n=1 Tax=Mesorhizobium qingshengii TaxID=1165689 RepID=A0ABT4QUM0_9HYPH|nr:phage tail tip lysozyme [Mesorhizobium qingshengii]MCZ8545083.1 phage tail tip lysozyme [Mesorhizobium qingshengii]